MSVLAKNQISFCKVSGGFATPPPLNETQLIYFLNRYPFFSHL